LHWLNRRSASVRAVLQLLYTEAISPSGFSLYRGRATRSPGERTLLAGVAG